MYSTPIDLPSSYLRSAVEASLDIKKGSDGTKQGLPSSPQQERAGLHGQLDNGRHERGEREWQRGPAQALKLSTSLDRGMFGSVRSIFYIEVFQQNVR